ncbi:MAG TPA: hypothetical protein DFS52_14190 [Myxococcales bacterium]|nr:hypothetical protein [Myxococcales bacterium]
MKTLFAITLAAFGAASLFVPGAAFARAKGPSVVGGILLTPEKTEDGITFDALFGPTTRIGWEIGDFLNSEFSFQYTHAFGTARDGGAVADISLDTYAVGYRLTLDLFRKRGFTPFFGAGLNVGLASAEAAEARAGGLAVDALRSGVLLELHAVAGARYTTESGLGFRAEGAYSTYGRFFGTWMPSIGVFYSFK